MRGQTTFAAAVLNLVLAGTAMSQAPALEQMVPDARLGTRVAPLLLLGRPDVRVDLGLSPEQEARARDAIADLYARALASRGKVGREALAARREIDEAQVRSLDNLLDETQRTRLDQIDLQWEGPAALVLRRGLAEHLELNQAQRDALTTAIARRNDQRRSGPPYEADQVLAHEALGVLNPPQRSLWRAMLGRPFTPEVAQTTPRATRR